MTNLESFSRVKCYFAKDLHLVIFSTETDILLFLRILMTAQESVKIITFAIAIYQNFLKCFSVNGYYIMLIDTVSFYL